MLKPERQSLILQEINRHNKVLSSDLSIKLEVSDDTIRRDLNELAKTGKIVKVHGGALSKSFHSSSYHQIEVYAAEGKTQIAKKAVQLLKDGMFILISGGTTCQTFAKNIPHHLNLTVFTVSLSTAMQLMDHPNIEVIFLGGRFSKNTQMVVGGNVFEQLNLIKMDYLFTGLNGLHPLEGMTDNDWEVVQLSKAMIAASKKVVALTIAEKLMTMHRIKVCDINRIDMLITDLTPEDQCLLPFQNESLNIL